MRLFSTKVEGEKGKTTQEAFHSKKIERIFLKYGGDSVLNSIYTPLATNHHESIANEAPKPK